MKRAIKHCDIVDDPADALIYSANVFFNCSGGVGGALLMKYGVHVQRELHGLLQGQSRKFVERGEVIDHVPIGLPYRHLIHTFPCDGFYDTSQEIVEDILRRALAICGTDRLTRRVAVSALATGYGHLTLEDFVALADGIFHEPQFETVAEVVLCFANDLDFETARHTITERHLQMVED